MKDFNTRKHFAFNVWDCESAKAVIDAAAETKQDVILQTSVSIFKNLELNSFRGFVSTYAESQHVNAWLNIDHCKDEKLLRIAIDHGWDMVMVDGSSMPIDQNIEFVNRLTEYGHSKGVLIEGEVGQVKGIEEELNVQQNTIASKNDIQKFIDKTNVDYIAVAFGNAHGEYKVTPVLHYDLVDYTTSITDIPFVVHGGSGLTDDVVRKLFAIHNVTKFNISTDLKIGLLQGIKAAEISGKLNLEGFQPLSVTSIIHDSLVSVAKMKMKLI